MPDKIEIVWGIVLLILLFCIYNTYLLKKYSGQLSHSTLKINFKLNQIMSQVSDLKDKINAQSTALDAISGSVTGIQADVAALKQKISDLSNGATAAEIAELSALVDGVSSKIDTIATTTASLDAETDSQNP
jgi:methyl-accepting chemotaxis protein